MTRMYRDENKIKPGFSSNRDLDSNKEINEKDGTANFERKGGGWERYYGKIYNKKGYFCKKTIK